uniref:Succinate dehydrogenase subunit 4 n=1 Tax=Dipterosiphonia australica TaxID=2007208 RepID=UPI0022FD78AE|nr:Succinate dehydrogenase subunit 4 [Dipterosiphonia australica]WAX04240.1 Succinate dehydrogenase subunit 4 [Dipterosiphonia australica]
MFFWFFRYFSVLFFLVSLLVDLEFLFLFLTFIFIHIFNGLLSLIKDYVHQNETQFLIIFFNRLIILFTLNILIELYF